MPRFSTPGRQGGVSTVLVIVLVAVILLMAVGGTAGVLYATGVVGGAAPDAAAGDTVAEEAAPAPPLYLPLEPALVANFEGRNGMGYLQASVEVMAREADVISAVQEHMPVVRNNLLMLLSSQTYADIDDRDGKERLREQSRQEINRVLAEHNVGGEIEAVYFTAFVVQ